MARRRKRKSRRRQEGRRILEHVPQYSIESGEEKPVTAARKFIQAEGIAPPALLLVKRNEHTTDRYFNQGQADRRPRNRVHRNHA